ncbi:MAG: DUF3307 domain-containing protein [Cyclonatronaceae bacterium]
MTELWRILVPLLIAHLLTDFVLQTRTMVAEKSTKNFRSIWIYIHAGLAGALAYLLGGMWSLHYLFWVTALSHLLIDGWKNARPDPDRTSLFFIDQALHLLVVAGLCVWVVGWDVVTGMVAALPVREISILILGVLILMNPSGFMIEKLTWKWSHNMGTDDLPGAGHWIGILERIMIFVFVLLNQYAAIGFLIAAKSILRFGSISQKRQVTEYVLVGTLLSFTIAIVVGLLVSLAL